MAIGEILGANWVVLVAARSATGRERDRHAKARRPLVGSGSVAAAARVEPSPTCRDQLSSQCVASTSRPTKLVRMHQTP